MKTFIIAIIITLGILVAKNWLPVTGQSGQCSIVETKFMESVKSVEKHPGEIDVMTTAMEAGKETLTYKDTCNYDKEKIDALEVYVGQMNFLIKILIENENDGY